MQSKRCSHNLQSDYQGSSQRICLLIMRITSYTKDRRVFEKEQNHGGRRQDCFPLSYFSNWQIYWFYVAFQTCCVFCFFLVTIFLRRVCSTQHIAAYTKVEGTAEDLVFWCKNISKVKVAPRDRAFSNSCNLFINSRVVWILSLNLTCWLIVINEVKCTTLMKYESVYSGMWAIKLSCIIIPINLTLSPVIFICTITSTVRWPLCKLKNIVSRSQT